MKLSIVVLLSLSVINLELSPGFCYLSTKYNEATVPKRNNIPMILNIHPLRYRRQPSPYIIRVPPTSRVKVDVDSFENRIQEIRGEKLHELSNFSKEWFQESTVLLENRLKRSSRSRLRGKMSLPGDLKSLDSADEIFKEQISSVGHMDSWKFIENSDVSKFKPNDDMWYNFEDTQDTRVRIPRDISDQKMPDVQASTTERNQLGETPEIVQMNITEIFPEKIFNSTSVHLKNNNISVIEGVGNEKFSEIVHSNMKNSLAQSEEQKLSDEVNKNSTNDGEVNLFHIDKNASTNSSNANKEIEQNISTSKIEKDNSVVYDSAENFEEISKMNDRIFSSDIVKTKESNSFIFELANVTTIGQVNETDSSPGSPIGMPITGSKIRDEITSTLERNDIITDLHANSSLEIKNETNSYPVSLNVGSDSKSSENKSAKDFIFENCARGKPRRKAQKSAKLIDTPSMDVSTWDSVQELNHEFLSAPAKGSTWENMRYSFQEFAVEVFYDIKDFTRRAIYSTEKIFKIVEEKTRQLFHKVSANFRNIPVTN